MQRTSSERSSVAADFTNGAGRHLCEDGAQFSDELVFAFGAAEVRAIEVLLDVEALERVRAGDERADGFSSLAAEQISGVAAGGQRRDEQSQARWSGDLCGPQDRLGAGVVAVKHEHDRRCGSLERVRIWNRATGLAWMRQVRLERFSHPRLDLSARRVQREDAVDIEAVVRAPGSVIALARR